MIAEQFEIKSDHDKKIVHIVVAGFWQPKHFTEFAAAINAEERYFTIRNQTFKAICDARYFNVQSGDIFQMFVGFFARSGVPITRAALVISSALLKLQVMRVIADSKYQFFDDVDAAKAWIANPPVSVFHNASQPHLPRSRHRMAIIEDDRNL
jgi:hypothetical protein